MKFDIPKPCEQSWDAMERRPGGRYCDHCERTVIDLSSMSRAQAEARLSRTRGDVCANVWVDQEGAPVFLPGPRRAPYFVGGIVLAAGLTAGGCSPDEPAASAEISVVADEPCELAPGPPMIPVQGGAHEGGAELGGGPTSTGPVAAEVDAGSAEPTAEQLERTAAKHRVTQRRGGMRIHYP